MPISEMMVLAGASTPGSKSRKLSRSTPVSVPAGAALVALAIGVLVSLLKQACAVAAVSVPMYGEL